MQSLTISPTIIADASYRRKKAIVSLEQHYEGNNFLLPLLTTTSLDSSYCILLYKVQAMQNSSEIYFYFFARGLIERELVITMDYFLFF